MAAGGSPDHGCSHLSKLAVDACRVEAQRTQHVANAVVQARDDRGGWRRWQDYRQEGSPADRKYELHPADVK